MTKNRELGIIFWMQGATKTGEIDESTSAYDLERDFPGLTYSKAEGLLTKGRIKNTYSEQYADSDRLRVWHPNEHKELVNGEWVDSPQVITRESTKVTFTFFFVGEQRYTSYESFYEYITGGYRAYWDNKRKKRLFFYCNAEYKPATEKWYGSTPYLELTLEVNNLFGDTFDVE